MRTSMTAIVHREHVAITKMDQVAEAFWWPGMHREIREKSENCPSCRAAGKNVKTRMTTRF